jgi:L-ascorbate metabolism protein UlaG (beta-lactamase superfamily)
VVRRLRQDVRVDVRYDDSTSFGSPVGSRPDDNVQAVFAAVLSHVSRYGFGSLITAGPRLLAEAVLSPAFSRIAELGERDWRIHDTVLYPDPALAQPTELTLVPTGGGRRLRGRFGVGDWPSLHELVSALAGDGVASMASVESMASLGATSGLLGALEDAGLVEEAQDGPVADAAVLGSDLTFVGHNTVVVRSATSAVLVDPWFVAAAPEDPAHYRPLQPRDVGPVDAVAITHSHPDHFVPSTLIQLPPSTRMIVPRVERETILTVAMATRLRELGFTDVVELDWWQSVRVGDVEVVALPFYGEQATDAERLHPDIRNHGNTYFIRTPSFSAAFVADSGRDGLGDVRQVAARARREVGSPDVLFAGYRGWLTYPVQLLFTSVARYLLFVPRHLWGVRQRLMTTADEAVDLAEIWGAPTVVPYADGGAPWYWRMGLGPRLDEDAPEAHYFDPLPERVLDAAHNRTEMPGGLLGSPIRVVLLRPGDSISDVASSLTVTRVDGCTWPYRERFSTTELAGMPG